LADDAAFTFYSSHKVMETYWQKWSARCPWNFWPKIDPNFYSRLGRKPKHAIRVTRLGEFSRMVYFGQLFENMHKCLG
jgi:hypothetical protein